MNCGIGSVNFEKAKPTPTPGKPLTPLIPMTPKKSEAGFFNPKQEDKSLERLKLESLIEKYPDRKDEIFKDALNGWSAFQIEAGWRMKKAGEKVRDGK